MILGYIQSCCGCVYQVPDSLQRNFKSVIKDSTKQPKSTDEKKEKKEKERRETQQRCKQMLLLGPT